VSKRILRYHREVFLPEKFADMFNEFYTAIYSAGPLSFSAHSVIDKLIPYSIEFGKQFVKSINEILRAGALEESSLFEFYTSSTGEIQKACFRHPLKFTDLDVVFVISRNCVIITIYTIDRKDKHQFLNKSAYVRKEKK
jgi:hypothetical protein